MNHLNERKANSARVLVVLGLVTLALNAGTATAQSTSPTPPDTSGAVGGLNAVAAFMLGIVTPIVIFLIVKLLLSIFNKGTESH